MNSDIFQSPVLHLVCGKIAAGKSTLTRQLAERPNTVLISEDVWLSQLYTDEIHTLGDYVRRSGQLRNALAPHIESLLRVGLSVVLDFPANTLSNRRWMKDIIDGAGVSHELHYLDVSDEVCKTRLRERNTSGAHPFAPSDAEFDEITRYLVPPTSDEGFHIVRHEP
ncbi:ATP-binding protein [Rhodanobacter sp. C03]|uniref:AAA family ATPase n=1 Tax=Rhodanobacter sp. C03 TaxID=1945858 RepID=UPI000985D00E|nr:ATP-binding protein [Rhodanobacter sp. C03]OOG56876.1 cell division protein ZipA [Rhodanobacter sp. C03]